MLRQKKKIMKALIIDFNTSREKTGFSFKILQKVKIFFSNEREIKYLGQLSIPGLT